MRSMKRDSLATYISGLGAINNSMCIMFLENNKMYDAEQAGKVKAINPMETVTRRKVKQRNSIMKSWGKTSPAEIEQHEASRSPPPPTFACKNSRSEKFFMILTGSKIKGGYANTLSTRDENFQAHAYSSVFTNHKLWFKTVYTISGEAIPQFDALCQNIMGDLPLLFEQSMHAPRNSIKSKYFWHLLCYLQGEDESRLNERIGGMPCASLQSSYPKITAERSKILQQRGGYGRFKRSCCGSLIWVFWKPCMDPGRASDLDYYLA